MYLEFDGDRASRQVERYGDRWFHSDPTSPRAFRHGIGPAPEDQPLSEIDRDERCEISADGFEWAWSEAAKRGV